MRHPNVLRRVVPLGLLGIMFLGLAPAASAGVLGSNPPSNPECTKWTGVEIPPNQKIALEQYVGYGVIATTNPEWAEFGTCIEGANRTTYGYSVNVQRGTNPYVGTVYSVGFSETTPEGHYYYTVQFIPGGWCPSGPALVGTIYTNETSPPTRVCI